MSGFVLQRPSEKGYQQVLSKQANLVSVQVIGYFTCLSGYLGAVSSQSRSPHTTLRPSFHRHIDRIWHVLQWKYLLLYLLYRVVSYLLHCVSKTAVIVAKINTNISSHQYICITLHITEYYTLDICLKTYQILSLSSKCDNWLIFYSIKLIAMVFSS